MVTRLDRTTKETNESFLMNLKNLCVTSKLTERQFLFFYANVKLCFKKGIRVSGISNPFCEFDRFCAEAECLQTLKATFSLMNGAPRFIADFVHKFTDQYFRKGQN